MRKFVAGLALLVLSTCSASFALAQDRACAPDRLWANVQVTIAQYNPTIHEYGEIERNILARWYNETPPVTDHAIDRIFRVDAIGRIVIVFVVGDCVLDHAQVRPEQLEVLLPQA